MKKLLILFLSITLTCITSLYANNNITIAYNCYYLKNIHNFIDKGKVYNEIINIGDEEGINKIKFIR